MRQVACDVCGGEGRVPEQPCPQCDGRGREVRRRTLRVDVPAGIADGQRIRLAGRGHAGERGGPPGDLYVLVHVQADERFVRDGDDLVTVLDVPAPIAALGATLSAPTLDGDVEVEVAAGHAARRGRQRRAARACRACGARAATATCAWSSTSSSRASSRSDQRSLAEQLADSMTEENLRTDESLLGKLKRAARQ